MISVVSLECRVVLQVLQIRAVFDNFCFLIVGVLPEDDISYLFGEIRQIFFAVSQAF